MRAAVLRGGKIEVRETDDPTPGHGQILVKTCACGICASDLHFMDHPEADADDDSGLSNHDPERDIVMGHEYVAQVVDYGPGTERRWAKGTRVSSIPVLITPEGARVIGYSPEVPGGFGEYFLMSEAVTQVIDSPLPDEILALADAISVGWHYASGRGKLDPTGHLLRFPTQFLPMLSRRWRSLSIGGFEGLRGGHETLARWKLDESTPMEAQRILDPAPDPGSIRLTLQRAAELIPALATTPVAAKWAGYIDSTPDGVPVIDEMQSVPGLVLAAGFSGHGFGIGPGAAHLVADIVTGQNPIIDPHPFQLSRFGRGERTDVSEF